MAQIMIPQRKQKSDDFGQLLTLGGAVVGGFAGGGPAGAVAGANAGQMAGGMLAEQPAEGPPQIEAGGAMSRRQQQLDQTPLRQIRESINSLQYIPDPETRMAMAKPLLQADYMARQKA